MHYLAIWALLPNINKINLEYSVMNKHYKKFFDVIQNLKILNNHSSMRIIMYVCNVNIPRKFLIWKFKSSNFLLMNIFK